MNEFFFEGGQSIDGTASSAVAKTKKDKQSEEGGQLTVDVFQTDGEVVIKSTIAGVSADDIDVSIAPDIVTIKGSRQPDENIESSDYYYRELYWGAFSRTIILPEDIDSDNAKASMKNGVLTIRLPKLAKARVKKVKISN